MRTVLRAAWIAGLTLVFGTASIAAGAVDRKGRAAATVGRAWARCVLWGLGVEIEARGLEHLPPGPAVFAANHGSALDIPALFAALPVDFRFVHKRSLYFLPIVGLYLWVGGHVAIDRHRAFRARRSLDGAAQRIRGGISVLVFPEGTRSRDGEVGHFKRGSFVLALEAGVPVVPISIVGVKRVAPRGLPTLRPGTLEIVVHPPVSPAGRSPEDAAALAEEVRRMVAGACEA